jgi:hypothetical protein
MIPVVPNTTKRKNDFDCKIQRAAVLSTTKVWTVFQ